MGKLKIVVKLYMEDAKKRSEALQIAVGLPNVTSAALEGNGIVVVGVGVDPISLTERLRKKIGHTELSSIELIPEKKKENTKEGDGAKRSSVQQKKVEEKKKESTKEGDGAKRSSVQQKKVEEKKKENTKEGDGAKRSSVQQPVMESKSSNAKLNQIKREIKTTDIEINIKAVEYSITYIEKKMKNMK